jgi:CheY-like chemotaxis protein
MRTLGEHSEFDDRSIHSIGLAARILVVEDDAELREMIGARLRRQGFDVFEARSGDEALTLLVSMVDRRWPSDDVELIVMDLRMPGASGLEVAQILRAADWLTPVLLMTAYPDAQVLDEAAELGVTVLGKPFGLDDLSRAAIAALGTCAR